MNAVFFCADGNLVMSENNVTKVNLRITNSDIVLPHYLIQEHCVFVFYVNLTRTNSMRRENCTTPFSSPFPRLIFH